MEKNENKKPSFALSMGVLVALVAMMIVGFGIMRITLQSLLFLVIVVVALISVFAGYKWKQIQDAMVAGLMRGVIAMVIMFLIGAIIGSWISAGTVPRTDLLRPEDPVSQDFPADRVYYLLHHLAGHGYFLGQCRYGWSGADGYRHFHGHACPYYCRCGCFRCVLR